MEELVLSLFLEKWHRELCVESKRLCFKAGQARTRSRALLDESKALLVKFKGIGRLYRSLSMRHPHSLD